MIEAAFSPDDKREAAARVLEGETRKSVAKSLGIPVTTLARWCAEDPRFVEIKATQRRQAEEIIRLYQGREITLQEIADRYGITKQRVQQIGTRAGPPRRDPLPIYSEDEKEVAVARLMSGERAQDVASSLKVPVATLYGWCGNSRTYVSLGQGTSYHKKSVQQGILNDYKSGQYTFKLLGEKWGITRARAHQIVKAARRKTSA